MGRWLRKCAAAIGSFIVVELRWGVLERIYSLPGYLDDAQTWKKEWIPMLDPSWQWQDYLLASVATLFLGYAVMPQRLIGWVSAKFVSTEGEQDDSERQEVLRMMRTLQQEIDSLNAGNPKQQETASRILVLFEKLTQIDLCPVVSSDTERLKEWRKYLNFILPHVEEFGIGRARKETQKWNEQHVPTRRPDQITTNDERQDESETLLRDLRQLREWLEKNKADPYDPEAAIHVGILRQKHSDLLEPVGSDMSDLHRAILFCTATLEHEKDFSKAMQAITERLQKPFSVNLETNFQAGGGTGGATGKSTKPAKIKLRPVAVDRHPLTHAYRILRDSGVYQGKGDERTGISLMLRQAAWDGDITIWGIEDTNQSFDQSSLLKIPSNYWESYTIDPHSYESSVLITSPDDAPKKRYRHLHADMNEIRMKWAISVKRSS